MSSRNDSNQMTETSGDWVNNVRHWSDDFIISEKTLLGMTPANSSVETKFATCEVTNCSYNTGVGDFNSCTLRMGFSKCFTHLELEDVEKHGLQVKLSKNIIPVYYDIELSNDGEIEQIGACTDDGRMFSGIIRTSVRTNKSPFLRTIAPEIWNMLVCSPKDVIQSFVDWLKVVFDNCEKETTRNRKIVLVAHYGMSFDHLHLIRTMLKHGVDVPDMLLSDSVVMIKLMVDKNESAKLGHLRDKYVPWIEHVAHDADSDAKVLKGVMNMIYKDPCVYYRKFSIDCRKYVELVGLNMYQKTKSMEQTIRDACTS